MGRRLQLSCVALAGATALGLSGCDQLAAIKPTDRCYTTAAAPNAASGVLLVNSCTGDTWVLVHTVIEDRKPGVKGAVYAYRWYKVTRMDYVEGVLGGFSETPPKPAP